MWMIFWLFLFLLFFYLISSGIKMFSNSIFSYSIPYYYYFMTSMHIKPTVR